MVWFRKPKYTTIKPKRRRDQREEPLWVKCEDCGELIYKREWEENLYVCPKCNYHARLSAKQRIALLIDEGTFVEYDSELTSSDFLKFEDSKKYSERLESAKAKTGLNDAVISGEGEIGGKRIVICALDFEFMGGSMGSAVGEKITRAVEHSIERRIPLVIISCSGGARMQEGVASLMQMAKTSAAIAKHNEEGLLYISVLTHPTTGGVIASFASLGDFIIAESRALIGFAGPRVIEQTIQQKLPDGFQRAEFLLQHGLVDEVVDRRNLKEKLIQILSLLS
jgi:acetyl-CoA carboxylase carboxyl transferase subunit beta